MPPTQSRSPTELLAEIDTGLKTATTPDDEDAPKEPVERRKTLQVHYRTADGQVFEGAVVYEVPGVGDQLRQAALRARLRGGNARLDTEGEALIEMISYLEVTLGTRRPEWMRDLSALPDPALLFPVYEEARQHEGRFRDGGRDLRPGAVARP